MMLVPRMRLPSLSGVVSPRPYRGVLFSAAYAWDTWDAKRIFLIGLHVSMFGTGLCRTARRLPYKVVEARIPALATVHTLSGASMWGQDEAEGWKRCRMA